LAGIRNFLFGSDTLRVSCQSQLQIHLVEWHAGDHPDTSAPSRPDQQLKQGKVVPDTGLQSDQQTGSRRYIAATLRQNLGLGDSPAIADQTSKATMSLFLWLLRFPS
jgi:hypothetical protein